MKNKLKLQGSTLLLMFLFSMIFLLSSSVLINSVENNSEIEESNIEPKSNQSGKMILFDESHAPMYSMTHDDMMQNFSTDLESQGYNVDSMATWNASKIMQADVVIIVVNSLEYTIEEFYILHNFVTQGGGLFILGDAGTFSYWDELANSFGVTFSSTVLYDNDDYETHEYWINFTDQTNFGNHPITAGISQVQTLYGSGFLKIPVNAIPILMMDADLNSWYGVTDLASGAPAMVAFDYQYGFGRIVVSGDCNIFADHDYTVAGMSQYELLDNGQLARNIINWLSTPDIPDKIVVFDESHDPWFLFGPDLRMGVVPTTINVLFDESHNSYAGIDDNDNGIYGYEEDNSLYGDFAAILEGASFGVDKLDTWSEPTIYSNDVIVINRPSTVYSGSEISTFQSYIREGGSLCIIGDDDGWSNQATEELIQAFGADVYSGILNDTDDYDTSKDTQYIIFNETNLADHPIMNGITNIELMYTTGFNETPSNAISLIKTDSDSTINWMDGHVPDGNPSAQDLPVAIAFSYGKGRVIITLDLHMFYNTSTYEFLFTEDNALFSINMIRWLGEAGYYYSDYYGMKGYLEDAGYGVKVMLDYDLDFYSNADALIIPPTEIEYTVAERLEIQDYVENDGGLLLISDHFTWAGYSNQLLNLFDLNGAGLDTAVDVHLQDLTDYLNGEDEGYIIFDTNNFGSHPILSGVYEILYPVGTGFDVVPSNADILIKMDDDISAEWSNGTSAENISAMVGIEQERGRLVSIGDGTLWRDYLITPTEGFNNESLYIDLYDNRLLLINTIDWLTSNRAPLIEINTPINNATVNGTITISWTSDDFDGDSLLFDIEYSSDNGSNWINIGSNITNNTIDWNSTDAIDGNTLIRVTASDGSLTGFDEVLIVIENPFVLLDFLEDNLLYVAIGGGVFIVLLTGAIILGKKKKKKKKGK